MPASKKSARSDALELSTRRARMKTWLAIFSQSGNIRLACEAISITRAAYYYWMEQSAGDNPNPNFCLLEEDGTLVPFSVAADEAAQEAADRLEEEVHRRAVIGVEEQVFGTMGRPEIKVMDNGTEREVIHRFTGVVGVRKNYSDNLLMFLLKARRPAEFRENVKVEHNHGGKVEIESARDRLAGKLLQAIERRQLADQGSDQALLQSSSATPSDSHATQARDPLLVSSQPAQSDAGEVVEGVVIARPGTGESDSNP